MTVLVRLTTGQCFLNLQHYKLNNQSVHFHNFNEMFYSFCNSSLARMGHSFVTCDGNTFFMFGGYSLSQAALNDLWKFDALTETLTQLLPATNDEPGPRYLNRI